MVVPSSLIEPFRSALYDLQRPGQLPVQGALAEFMERGYFATHIRRIRQAYADTRTALVEALAPALEQGATISSQSAGLHLVISLPAGTDDQELARKAGRLGVQVHALSHYFIGTPRAAGLVVGYGYAATEKVVRSGRILGQLLRASL